MGQVTYVFCHGFNGWGSYDEQYEKKPYWGGASGDVAARWRACGLEAYAASVSPQGSAWDRACELYAQIAGTLTDYGAAHSEKFHHARYGRDFTGYPLIPSWDDDTRLVLIGHSFGGQALGLIANNTEISRAAFVASQAATWRLMTSPEKYRVFAFMNLVGVPLAHALGYAPGWAGIGEDLPKGVFLQWAEWVSSPRYLFDSKLPELENFAKFKGELRTLCFSDDPWATRPAVELLASGFTAIKPEVLNVKPSDVGAKAIGHFGFFRPDHRDTLWRGVAEWIQGE
jgi:hypothetical protein